MSFRTPNVLLLRPLVSSAKEKNSHLTTARAAFELCQRPIRRYSSRQFEYRSRQSRATPALTPLRLRRLCRLPCPVFCGHAHGARPIACSFRRTFIEEEYAVLHVATAGDRLVRCKAGETPVRTLPTMTPERTWYFTLVGLAVCIQQRPGLLRHRASRNSSSTATRSPLRTRLTACRR